jgi:hypothetical protein
LNATRLHTLRVSTLGADVDEQKRSAAGPANASRRNGALVGRPQCRSIRAADSVPQPTLT